MVLIVIVESATADSTIMLNRFFIVPYNNNDVNHTDYGIYNVGGSNMPNVRKYLKYKKSVIIVDSLESGVFAIAIVYVISAQAALGSNITIWELLLPIATLIGVKTAHLKGNKMPYSHYFNGVISTLSRAVMVVVIASNVSLELVGAYMYIGHYVICIASPVLKEAEAEYERAALVTPGLKRYSKKLRERAGGYDAIADLVGGGVAAIVLVALALEPSTIAIVAYFTIGPVCGIYRLVLISKYLR